MLTSKTVCQRRLDETRAGCLGAWRFFDNGKVTVGKIVDSWSERTRAAVAGRHVLAIHDTTEVHFSTKPKRRRGLGQCGHGNAYGLLAHVMMAVDADSTACLGLVTGQIWNRKTVQKTPLRCRALEQRESERWVETPEAAKPILAQAARVTVISDREGDIYPSWGRVPGDNVHMLTRVMSDRRLIGAGDATLHTVANSFPGRHRHARPAGPSAPTHGPDGQAGASLRRGRDRPPGQRDGPRPAAQRATAPGRGARDRCAGGGGTAALAAADHARGRRCRHGMADRVVV
jgi:hypothetical protein